MADKLLLYFTTQNVTAYRWKSGELSPDQIFASSDEGVEAFGVYVSANPKALYYMLVDLVEEDFSQETLPAVRGKDRRSLLERKIAQRYRDTSLALALSLGISTTGERREEKILFASFTNTQPFQPWLSVLRSREARLVGVYSVPLAAPLLAKRIGFKNTTFLLVSVSQAGLRQSYVDNGQIRFSRLGRADQVDPRALAEACAQESARIQQYLTNLRIIARDAGSLDVIMITPPGLKPLYEAACHSTSTLQFHIYGLDEVSKTAGLKSGPENAGSEALFLHVLAASQPAEQFAGNELRRFYHLWRARLALIGVGAAACAFCLMLSALKLADVYNVNQAAESDRLLEATTSQQYARIQESFPKTPTASDKLGLIVKNYQNLLNQADSPEPLLIQLSRALASSPQIELESIEWNAGTAQASKAGAAKAPAGSTRIQSAQISGRINIAQTSDYRAITQIIDQFTDALRQQPGIEVVSRRLPFDLTVEKSLSGDIGAQRATEVPRFTVVLSRKAAS
jgi:hypothetical protein